MYKDKSKQKEANRIAAQKHRQKGMTEEQIVIPEAPQKVIPYPAVLHALADPVKRAKLRRICKSLSDADVAQEVRYGVGGVTMDVVAEYLTALK